MKSSTVLAALFFVVSTAMTATLAMAIQVVPTWVSPLYQTYNGAGAGQTIDNVTISLSNSLYDINMLLRAAPVAGTSYSVLMSTSHNNLLSAPQIILDANAYNNNYKKFVVAFSTDVTNSGILIRDKNLHWSISKDDLFSGASFWFAGQSYSTNNSSLYSETKTAATPIPGAVWLLGSGIIGLIGLRRKNNATQHQATACSAD